MKKVKVGILMGSQSDWPVMDEAVKMLKSFDVSYEAKVLSAHRNPELVQRYAKAAVSRGIKVIIAGAGGAAHLAGVIAAHTTLPVIGIPIEGKSLKGLDSLLSTVQMPRGVPVATVAINGAANAAVLALQCLALSDAKIKSALSSYKKTLANEIRKTSSTLSTES